MEGLEIVGWVLLSVAVCCWLIVKRANAEINRIKVLATREISRANDETARARIKAAQLKLEIDAWKAGHAQGRSDVINSLPLMACRHESTANEPTSCGCSSAAQISNGV
jgi:hypothetical protein